MEGLVLPNVVVFSAIVVFPSLCVYAFVALGRWLGGTTGMRIAIAIAATLLSVLLLGAGLTYLPLLSEDVQSGDQFLGLILSALAAAGSLVALVMLWLVWHRQSKAPHS